jgi:hypothetical protein
MEELVATEYVTSNSFHMKGPFYLLENKIIDLDNAPKEEYLFAGTLEELDDLINDFMRKFTVKTAKFIA